MTVTRHHHLITGACTGLGILAGAVAALARNQRVPNAQQIRVPNPRQASNNQYTCGWLTTNATKPRKKSMSAVLLATLAMTMASIGSAPALAAKGPSGGGGGAAPRLRRHLFLRRRSRPMRLSSPIVTLYQSVI